MNDHYEEILIEAAESGDPAYYRRAAEYVRQIRRKESLPRNDPEALQDEE
jgi:hypothetical protein